jgi:light-regulated signal transduction histidine kinase (bacteriophytochrome)
MKYVMINNNALALLVPGFNSAGQIFQTSVVSAGAYSGRLAGRVAMPVKKSWRACLMEFRPKVVCYTVFQYDSEKNWSQP